MNMYEIEYYLDGEWHKDFIEAENEAEAIDCINYAATDIKVELY